jgi:hypothetical protein
MWLPWKSHLRRGIGCHLGELPGHVASQPITLAGDRIYRGSRDAVATAISAATLRTR